MKVKPVIVAELRKDSPFKKYTWALPLGFIHRGNKKRIAYAYCEDRDKVCIGIADPDFVFEKDQQEKFTELPEFGFNDLIDVYKHMHEHWKKILHAFLYPHEYHIHNHTH